MKRPGDSLCDKLQKRAWKAIDEKHLSETGGKVFLFLTATGWEKDRVRFKLQAAFSEMEDRYLFEGTVDPSDLKTINDWKISKVKS